MLDLHSPTFIYDPLRLARLLTVGNCSVCLRYTFAADSAMSLASLLNPLDDSDYSMVTETPAPRGQTQYDWHGAPAGQGPQTTQTLNSYTHDRDISSVPHNACSRNNSSGPPPMAQFSGLRSPNPSSDDEYEYELEEVAPRKRRRQTISCTGE